VVYSSAKPSRLRLGGPQIKPSQIFIDTWP